MSLSTLFLTAALLVASLAASTDQTKANDQSQSVFPEDPVSPEGNTEVAEDEESDLDLEQASAYAKTQAFPIEAGSWGGKVRAGPGMEFDHVASLKQGEAVLLLDVSSVRMNGYPWFLIQYREGMTGYKWGGILCARETTVEGLHRRCLNFRHLDSPVQVRPHADISAIEQLQKAYSLMPGYWVSSSDAKSVMVFDESLATHDRYDGSPVTTGTWTLEESPDSPTKVTLRRTIDGNVDVYSVLFLDPNELTLSYLPRGITLSYYRMN